MKLNPTQRLARFRQLWLNRPAESSPEFEPWLVEAVQMFNGIEAAHARRVLEAEASMGSFTATRFLEDSDPVATLARSLRLGPVDTTVLASSHLPSDRLRAAAEASYAREAAALAEEQDRLERERARQLREAQELARAEAEQERARREREGAELDVRRRALIEVQAEERDRKVEALCLFLAGERDGYLSMLHAWHDITHESERPDPERWKRSLRTRIGGQPAPVYDSATNRRHESVSAASFGEILGDSITRRVVAEYETAPGLQAWRWLVSSIRTSIDFRTQRATRLGGYGQLPVVAENAPFQPITTPGDEEATYAASKRGGIEELTFEAFINGDGGEYRQVPIKLGRAAANTLNRAVLDELVLNRTTYDGTALFDAAHSNTAATTLSSTNLYARRKAMRQQAAQSDSTDVIGAVPRFLVIPPDLEEAANVIVAAMPALVNGDAVSAGLREPLDVIVANHWTSSATQWFVVANPRTVPTIEVGFTAATPDPQILIGPDPNTDKVVVKVRHAWGLTVVDYRGFQRGNT